MFTFIQMQEIAQTNYVIFAKNNCPFCTASIKLLDNLVSIGQIKTYLKYTIGEDFDDATLGQLSLWAGWKPDGGQSYPSKPQIFMKGQYIGGNFEFYKSDWNNGINKPNLINPMRF